MTDLSDLSPVAYGVYLHLFCVEGGLPWWVAA